MFCTSIDKLVSAPKDDFILNSCISNLVQLLLLNTILNNFWTKVRMDSHENYLQEIDQHEAHIDMVSQRNNI